MLNTFGSSSSTDDIVESIRQDGYAIIKNVLDPQQINTLKAEIKTHLERTTLNDTNAFMGTKTKRFGRLLYCLPASRTIVLDPQIISILDGTLLRYGPTYQIHITEVMHIMRGEKAQVLHRDISPFPNPGPTVVIATMWAITDFTRANGATVFVPGSHKWPSERAPLVSELRAAEMKAGSVFLYAGNLIHGGGSSVDDGRTGLSLQYSVGWLRQEENQYLAVPFEVAQTFDTDLQKIMGYNLADQHWGYVDQTHPLDFLNNTPGKHSLSPDKLSFVGKVICLHTTEHGYHTAQRYHVILDD